MGWIESPPYDDCMDGGMGIINSRILVETSSPDNGGTHAQMEICLSWCEMEDDLLGKLQFRMQSTKIDLEDETGLGEPDPFPPHDNRRRSTIPFCSLV